jgi:hypothetical protein
MKIFNNLTCFNDANVIGVKIVNKESFNNALHYDLRSFDFTADAVNGTYCVPLHSSVCHSVSSALGNTSQNPEDYKIVHWKGRPAALLKREFALKPGKVYALLSPMQRYLADHGNQLNNTDKSRVLSERFDYALTDVIVIPAEWTSYKVKPPALLTFVKNLTSPDGLEELFPEGFSERKLCALAKNVLDFYTRYTVVTD